MQPVWLVESLTESTLIYVPVRSASFRISPCRGAYPFGQKRAGPPQWRPDRLRTQDVAADL